MGVLGTITLIQLACNGEDPPQDDDSSVVDDTSADDSSADDSSVDDSSVDDSGSPDFEASVSTYPTMVNVMSADIELGSAHAIKVACEAPTKDPWPERIVVRSETAKIDHEVVLDGLLADTTYTCVVDDEGTELGTFDVTTDPLPAEIDFTGATVEFDDIETYTPGWTLYNPVQQDSSGAPILGANLVVDAMGRVRWYYDWAGYDGDAAFEYDVASQEFYGGGGFHIVEDVMGWDMWGNEVYRLDAKETGVEHDVDRLGDDYFLLTAGDDGAGGNHCIDRYDAKTTLVGSFCTDDTKDLIDWFANSAAVRETSEGTFVYGTMQIRGIVYKVNFDTGDVVWQLEDSGDFTDSGAGTALTFPPWMHDLQVVDCAGYDECLLVYVNGVDADHTTYIRKIGIDEAAMEATVIREWTEKGWEESKLGGIQEFADDRWLVCEGHFLADEWAPRQSQLVEVAPDDSVAWRLTVATTDIQVYRARRVAACEAFHHAGYCPSLDE